MIICAFIASGARAPSRPISLALNRWSFLAFSLILALISGCGVSGNTSFSGQSKPSPTATPAITPASGTSGTASLSVMIADSAPSATIFYTVDGSTPTPSSKSYSGPIVITANTTIKAIAMASGYHPNAVASGTYTVSAAETAAAAPTFSPASGAAFASTLSVSIADSTQGATIYYTTNGSIPTRTSRIYSGPITITANTTANAIATASGFAQSAVRSASYTLRSVAANPTFSPASRTNFASTLSVSIADSTPGATIYYTTNGSAPTTSSSVYSGPITISASSTVKAIAGSGFTTSGVASASYTSTTGAAGVVSDNLDEPLEETTTGRKLLA
jgi:Chitobiase/beta-hexosaminidase C-terminal domain